MFSLHGPPRSRRAALIALTILAIFTFWAVLSYETNREHLLMVDSLKLLHLTPGAPVQTPSPHIAKAICRTNNFPVYGSGVRSRKVYDLVLLSTELD